MAQYNDLFGFDRFAQAQNIARGWDREREQDAMRREQYAMQQEGQRQQNALAQLQMQREGDTQNALRLGIENQPYLETLRSDPAMYNEAQAVNRQDMLRYNPRADVGAVAKFGDRMDTKESGIDYDIKQNEAGEFYHVPKRPGTAATPVGLKGKAPGPQVVVNGPGNENKMFEQAVTALPKDLETAVNSRRNISRLDQAIGIAEKYGNDVAGFGGQFQKAMGSVLAPFGLNTAKHDAAQILDSLTKEGAGSLRAAIIGPGQVSNYEQQIMQQVSGGRMSSAEGVIAILEHHRKTNEEAIDSYSKKLKTITSQTGYERASELYPAPQYKQRKYRDTFAPVTDNDIQWD